MHLAALNRAVAVTLGISLSGCAATGSNERDGTIIGGVVGGAIGAIASDRHTALFTALGTAAGAYVGSSIGRYLDEEEKAKMAAATQQAIMTGESSSWRSDDRTKSGQARVVESTARSEPIQVPVLKSRVKEVPPLDIVGGRYRTDGGANVRGGPGTDYEIVGKLEARSVVEVIGQVKDDSWYMISENGAGTGFVHTSLLHAAPMEDPSPSDVVVASSDVEQEVIATERVCRTVEQKVELAGGVAQTEVITACQGPNGWEIQS